MAFNDTDLDVFLDAFDATTVTVNLSGVTVGSFRGIFRKATEVVSPYEAEQIVLRPSIRCKESDLENVTRNHTFEIGGITYKAFGDPRPSNSGLVVQALVKA